MLPKWFSPLVVAIIAAGTAWFFSKQPQDTAPEVSRASSQVPDAFMENFTTRVMDAAGQTQYQLVAESMAHYPHDDHSQLQTPHLTVFRPAGEHWTIQSASGLLEHGIEQITLQGEVLMQQHLADAQALPVQIQTRELRLRPQESYAETDEYALITRGNSRLESTGLQADLKTNHLYLLSQVRSIYEAQP